MRKLKITEMDRLSVDEYKESEKTPLVVVLDHVRSLYNVGSVFRTADAFRLSGVCLCGITARPPHPEIHKTALGAEDSVSWQYFERTEDCILWLKERGYVVLAIEQCEGSTMLTDIDNSKFKIQNSKFFDEPSGMTYYKIGNSKLAVVLGNEVKGVQQQVIDLCDGCLEIPQFGTKHSMNVSVTAGIVIWELSKHIMNL